MHCKRTEKRQSREGQEELPRVEQYERQAISISRPSELYRSDERRDKTTQKEQSKNRRSTTQETNRQGKRSQQKEQVPTGGETNQTKRTRAWRPAGYKKLPSGRNLR
jgi:hypothetical protein